MLAPRLEVAPSLLGERNLDHAAVFGVALLDEQPPFDQGGDGARRLYRADTDALEELRSYLNDLWASSLKVAQSITEAEHRGDTDEQREVG